MKQVKVQESLEKILRENPQRVKDLYDISFYFDNIP